MSIGALDATLAYGRLVRTTGTTGGTSPSSTSKTNEAGGFGELVSNMVNETATSMRAAEQASMKHVAGKGDLIDVTTAIGAAEMALDTVVAVRDRVVSAYSDIMHMQI